MNSSEASIASVNDRKLAYIAHLGPVIAAILGVWIANEFLNVRLAGIGGPLFALAFWFFKRGDSSFIRMHAAEAFNFNFSMFLCAAAMLILWELSDGMLFLLQFPLAMVQLMLWIFCPILAANAEKRGKPYRYPLSLHLLS